MLEGIRVVSLTTNIPGPLAAARLRALGARVLKIEPLRGDALEASSPAWYARLREGQRVERVDLRDEHARAFLDAQLADADVLLSAVRVSVLSRLGLSWEQLRVRFPRLCHVALSGEAPPHDDRAGHDLTYQARAGLVVPPAMPRTLVGDMAAAERVVSATLGALLARERTGRASRTDVSIVECAREFSDPLRYGLTAPTGELGGALPTYNLYPSADGWVAVAALEAHFLARLALLLETDRHDAATLRERFKTRTSNEWERLADDLDVPLVAVRDAAVSMESA